MTEPLMEPWLRGIAPDLHPVTGHLLRASQQIREDIERALRPLTPGQIWATPFGMTSAGFHAKHLAGSTRRLCTYLAGAQLTAEQVGAIPGERTGTESAAELLTGIEAAFDGYEALVRALRPEDFATLREIGRKRLRTTAVSLAIHIAEHGQRHAGQAISAAKLACVT
ncbi:MAG: DinB family protein [Acidobacteriota bacterium]